MKLLSTIGLPFLLLSLVISSCKKERNWEAEVINVTVDSTEARVEANFFLQRNNNYVDVGVCWSDSINPTIINNIREKQQLKTGESSFYIENLDYETNYHIRGFIKSNSTSEIMYSENYTFTTQDAPKAPCETELGQMSYNGSNFSATDLYASTGDYYKLSTSSSFGEIDFVFNAKPTKNSRYTTVQSNLDLTNNTVRVSGILGLGWLTCFHGGGNGQKVYIEVAEDGNITIKLCAFKMYSTSSCEDAMLSGAVSQ